MYRHNGSTNLPYYTVSQQQKLNSRFHHVACSKVTHKLGKLSITKELSYVTVLNAEGGGSHAVIADVYCKHQRHAALKLRTD